MIAHIQPDWALAPSGVGALSTLRGGGVSSGAYGDASDDAGGKSGLNLGLHVGDRAEDVAQNRQRLRALLPSEPAWLTQVHGNLVLDAVRVLSDYSDPPEADASFTATPGVVCVIQTADCLPVLLADLQGRVVGAAHGGWRGLAGGVLANTVAAMRAAGASEIVAWLGPAIGPDQFEVGEDVLHAFVAGDSRAANAFRARPNQPGKYLADIYQLARLQLAGAGVTAVSGGTHCTVSEPTDFYSYRRDRVTGRMASCIWIKPQQ